MKINGEKKNEGKKKLRYSGEYKIRTIQTHRNVTASSSQAIRVRKYIMEATKTVI